MSTTLLIQSYTHLQNYLQQLALRLGQGEINASQAIAMGQELARCWQTQLATSTGENLAPTIFSQWRSLHTEIHRELRLLSMDLMFLGSSRSAQTQAAKQKIAGDRLQKILQYCSQIQQIICPDDPHTPAT
ncbi:heterocyst frequency control protein PatD [[Limnothrix rosea] IAM M-220]|uniref:heterocyst frequency control protein PatD n=1 Tax=[Limnothrix rosea] IAM M-220 TaxID=454133 RepID=UPI0009676757|nr:heterocyst frequency control protein PatD [[Limnothrix rosea] IAM M-220]OKH13150.1 hypothetical protein NIES208_15350 [[Limnothrix rosea] IAM M-220]